MNCCNFCGKKFYSKYTLQTHQRTAKKCIRLDKDQPDFKCEFCSKELNSKHRFDEHKNNCKERKDILIDKLQSELDEKSKRLTELEIKTQMLEKMLIQREIHIQNLISVVQKPKKTTDNIEPLNTDKDYINEKVLPHLTIKVVKGGYKKIVKCIAESYLKDSETGEIFYKCTDTSRRKFKYRFEEEVILDSECEKLMSILAESRIRDHCLEMLLSADNISTRNIFVENGEYGLIYGLFSNRTKLAGELVKYLC